MSDIKDKLVEANKKVIENSSERRAQKKIDTKGEAYSQKDLVSVIKEIDAGVNKTKIEGVVTDTFIESVGDKDNHLIVAIHTGMVIKRQEEGLPVNPNSKQFVPDLLPKNMQVFLGYGYYPIKTRTKKQEETEQGIRNYIQKGDITVKTGGTLSGMLAFSDEIVDKLNNNLPVRMARNIIFAIMYQVYKVDEASSSKAKNLVFLKKGFPENLSDSYIGIVGTTNDDNNALKRFVVKADTKSYKDLKNKGFNILFGKEIVKATYNMRNPDGSFLIDPTTWFQENKTEEKEVMSFLKPKAIKKEENKYGHKIELIKNNGELMIMGNFIVPVLAKVKGKIKVANDIEEYKLYSLPIEPGFNELESPMEKTVLAEFEKYKNFINNFCDTKKAEYIVDGIVNQSLSKDASKFKFVRIVPKSNGGMHLIFGNVEPPYYRENDYTGKVQELGEEFSELIDIEKEGGLKNVLIKHITGLFLFDAKDVSNEFNKNLREDELSKWIDMFLNIASKYDLNSEEGLSKEDFIQYVNGNLTSSISDFGVITRVSQNEKENTSLRVSFKYDEKNSNSDSKIFISEVIAGKGLKRETIKVTPSLDDLDKFLEEYLKNNLGVENAEKFLSLGKMFGFSPLDKEYDSIKGFEDKYSKVKNGFTQMAQLNLMKNSIKDKHFKFEISMLYAENPINETIVGIEGKLFDKGYTYIYGKYDYSGDLENPEVIDYKEFKTVDEVFKYFIEEGATTINLTDLKDKANTLLGDALINGLFDGYRLGDLEFKNGIKKKNPDAEDFLITTTLEIDKKDGSVMKMPKYIARGNTIKEVKENFIKEIEKTISENSSKSNKEEIRRVNSLDELD